MPVLSRKTPFILLFGDIAALVAALWLTLFARYAGVPSEAVFLGHLLPFSVLFLASIGVYFISGLYEAQAVVLKTRFAQTLLYAQLINLGIATGFFYLVSTVSIAPKTNLVVYLFVSSALILFWRLEIYKWFAPLRKESAVLIGAGPEMRELLAEVNGGHRYNFKFERSYDLDSASPETIDMSGISTVVIDFYDERAQKLMPELYQMLLSKVRFIDMHKVYEDVFGKVALSLLNHNWFLDNISVQPKHLYDALKRAMDFILAGVLAIVSLVLYPFVFIAIKLDDQGPIFIMQERVGRDGKIIRIPKFRSMKTSDKGVWVKENDDRITRVGKVLRQTRIDELPQLFSVVKGDMSLVGPRPDIYALGMQLSQDIPYYTLRSIIKPGLSGWAQIRQDVPPQSLEETKVRLAYDFYYIKNRSLMLDLKIALQTLATLASRMGK